MVTVCTQGQRAYGPPQAPSGEAVGILPASWQVHLASFSVKIEEQRAFAQRTGAVLTNCISGRFQLGGS